MESTHQLYRDYDCKEYWSELQSKHYLCKTYLLYFFFLLFSCFCKLCKCCVAWYLCIKFENDSITAQIMYYGECMENIDIHVKYSS